MPAEKKRALEVHIRGKQKAKIDADLIAQTVMMLGRELAIEAGPGEKQPEQ